MMSSPSPLRLHDHAAVIVTFHPDLDVLRQQLASLGSVGQVVLVDNGSPRERQEALGVLAGHDARVALILLPDNEGLAAALNLGIARASERGACSVLMLDQDSLFSPDVPARLLEALDTLQRERGQLCCIGPALRDPQSGMSHGFHYIANGWRWARAFPAPSDPPFPVANLNGSGTTVSLELLRKVGPLDASLFIDHIDTDYSFRVLDQGFALYGLPGVVFEHQMGERGRRIWLLGWRVWPERSPQRHYYLFRNTVRLLGRRHVPMVWKSWAIAKLAAAMLVVGLTDPRRKEQLRMMWKGIAEAMWGRSA